jgi:hypothetical protein
MVRLSRLIIACLIVAWFVRDEEEQSFSKICEFCKEKGYKNSHVSEVLDKLVEEKTLALNTVGQMKWYRIINFVIKEE